MFLKGLFTYVAIIAICVASTLCGVSKDRLNKSDIKPSLTSPMTNSNPSSVAGENLHAHDKLTANSTVLSSKSTVSPISKNTTSSATTESEYYDYYEEKYGPDGERIRNNSKIAQVVIYFSIIFIALAGILIKHFITQFETSQMKAQEQLNYHRLHNQRL